MQRDHYRWSYKKNRWVLRLPPMTDQMRRLRERIAREGTAWIPRV